MRRRRTPGMGLRLGTGLGSGAAGANSILLKSTDPAVSVDHGPAGTYRNNTASGIRTAWAWDGTVGEKLVTLPPDIPAKAGSRWTGTTWALDDGSGKPLHPTTTLPGIGQVPAQYAARQAGTAYSVGDRRIPTGTMKNGLPGNGYYYEVANAGTSGAGEPTWGGVTEELIINGGFDSDSWWTKNNVSIGNGTAKFAGAVSAYIRGDDVIELGKTYRVIFTILDYSAGSITPHFGWGSTGTSRSSDGTFSEVFVASGANTNFYLYTADNFAGSIDDVSVQEVTSDGSVVWECKGYYTWAGTYIHRKSTVTNQNTNYNANPDAALTNVSVTGAASITRQSDATDLTNAGLGSVCSDGNVFAYSNTTGASQTITIGGTVGNTNAHSYSVFAQVVGGTVTMQLTGGTGTQSVTTSDYSETVKENVTPLASTDQLQFVVPAGVTFRWVLNQLIELPFVPEPIITRGATATRSGDSLTHPNIVPDGQGMGWLMGSIEGDTGSAQIYIHTQSDILYTDSLTQDRSYDGTSTTNGPLIATTDPHRSVTRWSGTARQVTSNGSSGSVGAYDGTWGAGSDLDFGSAGYMRIHALAILRRDPGQTIAEAMTAESD